MSKYNPIGIYLESRNDISIKLSFSDIERILGFELPNYLKDYVAGWYGTAEGSPTHRQKAVWCGVGYQVDNVNLSKQEVIFKKCN